MARLSEPTWLEQNKTRLDIQALSADKDAIK